RSSQTGTPTATTLKFTWLGSAWRPGLGWIAGGSAQVCARDRQRMTQDGDDAPQSSPGLVEEAELAQHRSTVIVDALARQLVIGVERIYRAKRELQPPVRRRQAAPRTEMRTPDGDLQHD